MTVSVFTLLAILALVVLMKAVQIVPQKPPFATSSGSSTSITRSPPFNESGVFVRTPDGGFVMDQSNPRRA